MHHFIDQKLILIDTIRVKKKKSVSTENNVASLLMINYIIKVKNHRINYIFSQILLS